MCLTFAISYTCICINLIHTYNTLSLCLPSTIGLKFAMQRCLWQFNWIIFHQCLNFTENFIIKTLRAHDILHWHYFELHYFAIFFSVFFFKVCCIETVIYEFIIIQMLFIVVSQWHNDMQWYVYIYNVPHAACINEFQFIWFYIAKNFSSTNQNFVRIRTPFFFLFFYDSSRVVRAKSCSPVARKSLILYIHNI